jgi:hypothetical protein
MQAAPITLPHCVLSIKSHPHERQINRKEQSRRKQRDIPKRCIYKIYTAGGREAHPKRFNTAFMYHYGSPYLIHG